MNPTPTTSDEHEPPSCAPVTPPRHFLDCCVCGGGAGRWAQHWNRDDGYGICADCVAEEAGRVSPDVLAGLYGKPGVHYRAPTFDHLGRRFKVLATFPVSPKGIAAANAFMEARPGAAVLAEARGRAILADVADLGEPI